MKKGFTLIELLAVIVILAIISLIATPVVLSIINNARESSSLRSAEFYLDAVEYSITESILDNDDTNGTYLIMEDGNLCIGTLTGNTCDGNVLNVEVNGEKPTGGSITIENGNITDVSIDLNDRTITQNSKGELVYQAS